MRGLSAAAALAVLQALGAPSVKADVLLSNFEGPLGNGIQGWFNYNGNMSSLGLIADPTGGTSNWMTIEYNNTSGDPPGNWTTAGPTIQPWANAAISNSNFQANNFLQFDVIFPSSSWLSNDPALAVGLNSSGGGDGLLITIDTTQKDTSRHVTIDYSAYKTAGGGAGFIDGWMNLLFGHPDTAQWGANPFAPQVYVDNIYLTTTSALPAVPPPPNNGTWDATKSGDWATTSNWVGGIAANGSANFASFGSAAAARTVNVNVPISIGSMSIDSANGYTFTAGYPITLAGTAPTIDVVTGSHTMAGVTISSTATFNVAAGAALAINDFVTGGYGVVNKGGLGAMTVNDTVNVTLVADGTYTITNGTPNGFIYTIVTLSPDAFIDLGSNNWQNNQIYGGGTVRIGAGGLLTTALYGDFEFGGTITGDGSVVFGGAGASQDHIGTFTGTSNYTGGTTIKQGTFIANNIARGSLLIDDPAATTGAVVSKVQILAKPAMNDPVGTSVVTSLAINGSAQLDLTNNALVIDYTGPVGTLVQDTKAMLTGGKIVSSVADATKGLGYGDNAVIGHTTFNTIPVDASSILIKYTYFGDTNLDGQVDITDLGNLATAWQSSGEWVNGDSDNSGLIDITDLGLLATNWQAGVAAGSSLSLSEALASVGLGGAAVPEPATASLIGLSLAGLLSRRRKH